MWTKTDCVRLNRAIQLAAQMHRYQRDKGGAPYLLHCLRVMEAVAPDPRMMQAAVMHDLIEDTVITPDDLIEEGFDHSVVHAVWMVSRPGPDTPNRPTYMDFIRSIRDGIGRSGEMARAIKIADLHDNLSPARLDVLPDDQRSSLAKRYIKALELLEVE